MFKRYISSFAALMFVTLAAMTVVPQSTEATSTSGWGVAEIIEMDNTGRAADPKVGFDTFGNAVAVWIQYDGTYYNVLSNRYTAGSGWGVEEWIETEIGNAQYPNVAVDRNGNAVAVWYQYDSTRNNIWSNRYTAGIGWGTAVKIETDDTGTANSPHVAVDSKGNAVAVWQQAGSVYMNIWSNRYTAGVGWGTAEKIETDDSGDAISSHVAVDPTGNATAVWEQFDGIHINIWSNRYTVGVGWGTAEKIETSDIGDAYSSNVAIDPAGNAIAVWQQSESAQTDIWSNRYTAGVGWGTAEKIETDDSGEAKSSYVAVDQAGNAFAVWIHFDGMRFITWSNRYTVGVGWGTAEKIETDDYGTDDEPKVAVDRFGNAIAVWLHFTDGNWNVISDRYVAGTGWGDLEVIETNNEGYPFFPQVTMDPNGNAIAVWYQWDSTRANIWANRYVMPDTTLPTLTVTAPTEGAETGTPTIAVSGVTEPGAIVNINGGIAHVAGDGAFSLNVALFPGPNTITITSTDASGNSISEIRTVTYSDPLPDLIADLGSLTDALSNLDEDVSDAYDEINALKDILAILEDNLTFTDENITLLLENLTALKEALNLSQDGALKELLTALEENLTDLMDETEVIRSDQDAINDDLTDLQDDLDAVQGEQGELRDDVDRIDAEAEPKDLTVPMLGLFILNLLLFLFLALLILILFIEKKGKGNRIKDEMEG